MEPWEWFGIGRGLARRRWRWSSSTLVAHTPLEQPGLGTFAVTENGFLLWDPACKDAWTIPELEGVFLHEVSHVLRDHIARMKRLSIPMEIANVAADLSINCMLKAIGVQLPSIAVYPSDYGFPDNLTLEEYAHRLMQRARAGQLGEAEGEAEGADTGAGEDGSESEGSSTSPARGSKTGIPKKPACGGGWCGSGGGRPVPGEPDRSDPRGRSNVDLDRLRRGAAEAIREAESKHPGSVPGDWVRWADLMLKPPKVDWRKELAREARAAVNFTRGMTDYTWARPSRRQSALGYGAGVPILPGMYAPEPSAAIIVDTSGSMGAKEGVVATSEAVGILNAIGCPADLCVADAEVKGLRKVRTIGDIRPLLTGGGGTDMRLAFEALEKRRPRPAVTICITDGWTPMFKEAPKWTKTLWLLVGESAKRPAEWGRAIRVPLESEEAEGTPIESDEKEA